MKRIVFRLLAIVLIFGLSGCGTSGGGSSSGSSYSGGGSSSGSGSSSSSKKYNKYFGNISNYKSNFVGNSNLSGISVNINKIYSRDTQFNYNSYKALERNLNFSPSTYKIIKLPAGTYDFCFFGIDTISGKNYHAIVKFSASNSTTNLTGPMFQEGYCPTYQ